MDNAISLYLIGGFLGAGKTTLLRHMLDGMDGRKVGVLVNEFGSVSIDGPVVRRAGVQMVELNNGSIFCACLKESFVKTLRAFAESDIDVLLVENSGMADPGSMNPLLERLTPHLARPYAYRGLICLADATTFLDYIDLLIPLQHQIQAADLVIVNKTDLADRELIDAIHETVAFFNDRAEIYDTVYATVPLDLLERRLHNHGVAIDGECACNRQEDRPAIYTLESDEVLTCEQVRELCACLARRTLRIKGFVRGRTGWLHADCVGRQIAVAPAGEAMEVPLERGKLVLIGARPDPFDNEIRAAWARCCQGRYELIDTR